MKRFALVALLFVSAVSASNAQTEEYITLGINGGVVNNINGFRQDPEEEDPIVKEYKNGMPGYNVAIDLGIRTSAKTRFRLEVEHEEFHYKAIWDTTQIPAASYCPLKTKVKVWNMGINLRFDYKIAESEKWKVFVSPGFLWEFNIDRESKNFLRTEEDNVLTYSRRKVSYKNYKEIAYQNPNHILGGNVQLLCKYKIAKHIALTLTPEYYIYFRPIVKDNTAPYMRMTLNGGVEFNF